MDDLHEINKLKSGIRHGDVLFCIYGILLVLFRDSKKWRFCGI